MKLPKILMFAIVVLIASPIHASADTTFSGTISGNIFWTKAAGPYITSGVYIPPGSSLAIEPGTIIKVADNGYPFTVEGALTIGSVGGEMVTITSIKDDTMAGDTNGDGSATTPTAGDWRSITIGGGGSVALTNVIIRYGGASFYGSFGSFFTLPIIKNNGGMLALDHVTLAQGQSSGITQISGATTLTNSTITDCLRGIQNEGGRLELANNTFANMSDYSVIVYGASDFVNRGGNHGNRGMYMASTMTGAQVWGKDNIPYLLPGMNISAGSSLTIAPGVLMKVLDAANPFFVDGTLIIGSTTSPEQVSITSFQDDSIGGDTNGNGTTTVPHAGDWRMIRINSGGVAHIENTTISYGGATVHTSASSFTLPLIQNIGGILTLDNVTLSESQNDGITQTGGLLTVSSSTFTHLEGNGIFTAGSGNMLTVSNSTFNTLARGVYVSDGTTFTTRKNSFTHLSTPESIRVDSSFNGTQFINQGDNSGEGGIALSLILNHDTVLPKDGLAYIVRYLEVQTGVALTIMPGAIVKIPQDTNFFSVSGTLNIGGLTPAPETYITSLSDDTVGGDTNKDDILTAPASGDWRMISFNPGSHGNIANTTIRYGGATFYGSFGSQFAVPAINNTGGTLVFDHTVLVNNGIYAINQTGGTTTMTNSEVSHTDVYGIVNNSGVFSIHNSSIHDNGLYGLYNSDVHTVDAANNWWGSASGPTHPSNPGGTGDKVSGNVDFGQWLTEEPSTTTSPNICTKDCNSNVLFLPGIMGSRLYWTNPSCVLINCENKLWIPNRNDDVEDLYMATGTSLISDIYTKEDDILLDGGPFGADFYKVFADDMNSMVASGTIEAWKPIAYDWRYDYDHLLSGGLPLDGKIYYDVPTSFPYIIEELYALASSSKTGKVTIVAHSNGGLLAKTLIQKLTDLGHADLVDNLVLVASPQLGTPQAIGALLHGYDASFLKYYVGKSAQRKLAHDMPMTYNLLPSEKYLSTVSTPVITFDEDVPDHALWGDEINNTGEYLAYLLGIDNRPNPDYGELEDPTIANETLLTSALEWHANFDDWIAPTTTTVYEIAGWGVNTVSGIHYSNDAWLSDFSWDYEPVITEDGDGTVVTPSALGNDGQKYWVNLKKYRDDTDNTVEHGEIFEVPQLRTLIKNIIRKEDITNPGQYISTTRPSAIDIEKRLRYFLHSPLTLELYDSEGRHVGVSTTTGLIEEQIPGASYDEFGEVKYISVPARASMTLVMHGEGVGRFTLNIQEVTGGIVTATTTFANIPVSTSTFVTMSVSENPTLTTLHGLSIDQDGNGTIDTHVSPGTILSPDRTPPEEQISFGTSTQKLLFRGMDTSSTSVVTTATSTIVTDASGNTLRLPLLSYKEKNRHILLSFNTLVYNGSTTTIATTTIKYKWNTNKKGEYTMFAAYIKTGSTTLEVHYRPKKNQTIIMTKPTDFDDSDTDDDCDVRPIRQKLSGMVVPGIKTSSGNIGVIY